MESSRFIKSPPLRSLLSLLKVAYSAGGGASSSNLAVGFLLWFFWFWWRIWLLPEWNSSLSSFGFMVSPNLSFFPIIGLSKTSWVRWFKDLKLTVGVDNWVVQYLAQVRIGLTFVSYLVNISHFPVIVSPLWPLFSSLFFLSLAQLVQIRFFGNHWSLFRTGWSNKVTFLVHP